jgi:hypothetical protein
MAQLVLGIGISHTPILNAALEDWSCFIETDRKRPHLDKEGNAATYDELLHAADAVTAEQIRPESLAARHAAVMANVERIRNTIRAAALDTLIVVGDDQNELYSDRNMPCILIYRGETIRNVPPAHDSNRPEYRDIGQSLTFS